MQLMSVLRQSCVTCDGLRCITSDASDASCESINGWIAIPMVRCGICAVSTLRMCFYACRISLISGLLNEDLICWVGS